MQRELQKFTAHTFTRSSNPRKFSQFGEFRRILFVETLGWDLTLRNDYELDEFDHHRAHYLTLSADEEIIGGFRAIRCDHPYLARTKFPKLAEYQQFPNEAHHWEISRFGVAPNSSPRSTAATLYSLMLNFGLQRQAEGLVAFTSLGHELYLRRLGVVTKRYGEPSCIGESVTGGQFTVVAGEIPLNTQETGVLSRLISISHNVRLVDDTSIQRPARVSA
jgi:acyl homoserine lactone synthase